MYRWEPEKALFQPERGSFEATGLDKELAKSHPPTIFVNKV